MVQTEQGIRCDRLGGYIIMLYMDFNTPKEKVLRNPGADFNSLVENDWFDDPNIVAIAEGIDGVKHIGGCIFESDERGLFESSKLSGGAKTVILAYRGELSEYVYPLSWLGENCFEYLTLVPDNVNVTFFGDSMPMLYDWGCEFISKSTGATINSFDSYSKEF